MSDTGLRLSEACALQMFHINFEHGDITIVSSAYTELIGHQLLQHLKHRVAV